MRLRLLLFCCCLVFMSTLMLKATQSAQPMVSTSRVPTFPAQLPLDCGGQPVVDGGNHPPDIHECPLAPATSRRGRRAGSHPYHAGLIAYQSGPAIDELERRRKRKCDANQPASEPWIGVSGKTPATSVAGALFNHAQVQAAPPQRLLDDLAAFQNVLFTNPRVRALSDAINAGQSLLPDPDPPLDDLDQQGKAVFERACAQCHGGPSQSNAQAPVIRFHDIASQCPRPIDTRPAGVVTPPRFAFAPCPPRLERNARTFEIKLANGTTGRRTSSDPGRALLTGFVGGPAAQDDWNKFDVPGLRGISRTASYFHNNSAATLEDVVDHYTEFFKRVRVNVPGTPIPAVLTTDGVHVDRPLTSAEERMALLAYLRKL